jgi:hypothetical protein
MDVALPDGSVAKIEYYGDVAPKVRIVPLVPPRLSTQIALPVLTDLDRLIEDVNRRTAEILIQTEHSARQPLVGPAAGMSTAPATNMPPDARSYSFISVSNGASTCTRTTQVVSRGPGKPPKVSTSVSGQCAKKSTDVSSWKPRSASALDHT